MRTFIASVYVLYNYTREHRNVEIFFSVIKRQYAYKKAPDRSGALPINHFLKPQMITEEPQSE